MPATELSTAEGPAMYRRLARAIGEEHWQRAVSQQEDKIRSNFFLGDYLRSEFAIAYQLDWLRQQAVRFGEVPHYACNNSAIFPALAFAAQVLEVLNRSSVKQAKEFVKRVRTAFIGAEYMHGLLLELHAATHFVRRGHRVVWHRKKNAGTFDLLIEDLGPDGLEVECKSISEDKGRRIHRLDALNLLGKMWQDMASVVQNVHTGLAVVLTIPYRLPKASSEQEAALAGEVVARIAARVGGNLSSGGKVDINSFDPATMKTALLKGGEHFRKAIDDVTSTFNSQSAVYKTPANGVVVFAMQSETADDMLHQIFTTLDDSAERQFTRQKGALFWVALRGLDDGQLRSVHERDSQLDAPLTQFKHGVNQFLNRAPDHIVGVAFNSETSLFPEVDGSIDSGGFSNFFLKETSPFWDASFRKPLAVIKSAS